MLICADVIRPGLDWLLRFAPARHNLATEMARTRDPAAFAALDRAVSQGRVGLQSQQQALTQVAIIMAAKGGTVAAVRVGDCLELLAAAARTRATTDRHAQQPVVLPAAARARRPRPGRTRRDRDVLRPWATQLRAADRPLPHRVPARCATCWSTTCGNVSRRWTSPSLQRLAYLLGKLFWADLEAHHPGIDSLQLPRDVAAAWKQRVMTRTRTTATTDGEQVTVTAPRLDGRSVLTAVRAFYLDIAEWADDDPARWGPWAVRCPVSASDASHKKDRSHRKSRMDRAPANGCRCCRRWSPGWRPNAPAPPSCSPPPSTPGPASCSPPPG